MSGFDREDFFPSSRRCALHHTVGSNCHHLFLKRSEIEISRNVKLSSLVATALSRRVSERLGRARRLQRLIQMRRAPAA
jgi:hypothetical protein